MRRFQGSQRLRVLDAPGGEPGSTVLAEVLLTNAEVSLASEPFTTFEIPGGVPVEAGEQLAFAVDSPGFVAGTRPSRWR